MIFKDKFHDLLVNMMKVHVIFEKSVSETGKRITETNTFEIFSRLYIIAREDFKNQ